MPPPPSPERYCCGPRDASALVACNLSAGLASVMCPRIVLLAADGHPNTEIAARVRCSRQAVVRWRGR